MLAWPVLRTSIKIGRQGGDPGREITDAEEQLGLPHQALSPYVEASVGSIVRAGADFLDLDRSERFRTVHETVNAKGVLLANPGGQVASRFHYLQASAFVEWEVVRGASYRFALIGGARYLRIATRLRGLQPDGSVLAVSRESDVLSPFFGGSVELTPVPTFAVFASVRFIDWAWSDIQLREQRYFISRIGAEVKFFDGAVGVALDFRFLSSSLDTGAVGKTRGRFVLDAAGVGLSVTCRLP
ncbi:hypothetical protein HY251_03295 [bacterium]|nr:hypothetical protein [bacterium]